MAERKGRGGAGTPGEWVLALAAVGIVLAVAGLLVHQGLTGGRIGPQIEARVDSVARGSGGEWRVHFTLENRGGAAAADVRIEGRTADGWTAGTTLGLLPAQSSHSGVLVFPHEPAGSPQVRVTGWTDP